MMLVAALSVFAALDAGSVESLGFQGWLCRNVDPVFCE